MEWRQIGLRASSALSTYVVSLLRPLSTRKTTEIVAVPKVYAFDTGFGRVFNGWDDPRPQELGKLWEHYVLW